MSRPGQVPRYLGIFGTAARYRRYRGILPNSGTVLVAVLQDYIVLAILLLVPLIHLVFDGCYLIDYIHSFLWSRYITKDRTLKFLTKLNLNNIEVVAIDLLEIFTKQSIEICDNFNPTCCCRQYLLSLLLF